MPLHGPPLAVQQLEPDRVEARRFRDRCHEAGPDVFDQALDLAFIVTFAGAAEAVGKQIVADLLGERPRQHLTGASLARLVTAVHIQRNDST